MTLPNVLFALSDPTRLQIVQAIAKHDKMNCCEIEIDLSKSTASRHFRVLREAGIIRMEPRGIVCMNSLRRQELVRTFSWSLRFGTAGNGAGSSAGPQHSKSSLIDFAALSRKSADTGLSPGRSILAGQSKSSPGERRIVTQYPKLPPGSPNTLPRFFPHQPTGVGRPGVGKSLCGLERGHWGQAGEKVVVTLAWAGLFVYMRTMQLTFVSQLPPLIRRVIEPKPTEKEVLNTIASAMDGIRSYHWALALFWVTSLTACKFTPHRNQQRSSASFGNCVFR